MLLSSTTVRLLKTKSAVRAPPPPLVEVPPQLKLKAVGPTLVFLFFFLLPMTVTVQVVFFLLFSLSFCCSHPWLLRMFGFVLIINTIMAAQNHKQCHNWSPFLVSRTKSQNSTSKLPLTSMTSKQLYQIFWKQPQINSFLPHISPRDWYEVWIIGRD